MNDNTSSEPKTDPEANPDDTLYVSATESQPVGEITIRLEQDRKRKITIISECEPSEKKNVRVRRDSEDLRRQAIVNNAIRSQQTSSSRSRSRSRGRGRSLSRTRSISANKMLEKRRARSASRSRSSAVQKTNEEEKSDVSLRLPTHLSSRSVIGTKAASVPPEFLKLPSPLYILTEQQAIGVSEKKIVQFVTKILLTSKKLSLDDRKKLYAEMIEAEYVGTCRSSSDLHNNKDQEPEEDFQTKIYYSDKGIYIHTVQNVKKMRSGKTSSISEEKKYANICKTKIIGEKGASIDGYLNVSCQETVTVVDQVYSRTEIFKIGLKDVRVDGKVVIGSSKSTFDPTRTTRFSEDILFDNKNIGVLLSHKASARMNELWHHEHGSFGEEQSEYRELKFFFEDIDTTPAPVHKIVQVQETMKMATTPEPESNSGSERTDNGEAAARRRARSRARRRREERRSKSLTKSGEPVSSKSPDTKSSRVKRHDETPLKSAQEKSVEKSSNTKMDCTMNETLYHSLPRATSTPKSAPVADQNNNSSIIMISGSKTPPSNEKLGGVVLVKDRRSLSPAVIAIKMNTENEVDLDKSMGAKKPHSRNLSAMVNEQKEQKVESSRKIEAASIVSKVTSPGSVYMYNTGSANNSTYMNATELHKDRVSSMSPKPTTATSLTPSPKGTLRVKETKVTREVREKHGMPPTVSEKKEETVKEEKVKMRGRSISPATPTLKLSQTMDSKIVTLSAMKTESVSVSPIRVRAISESSQQSVKSFPEQLQVEMLVDKKNLVFNLNMDIMSTKQPDIEVVGFSFRGQKLWQKSSEWNITSANTTSDTKTIARQASNTMADNEKKHEDK